MGKKVYSYVRFSDAKQASGASSERQRAYAADWAKQNGLVLDEALSLHDEGLSAYHQKHVTRGALGVFLKAIENGQVSPGSVLVVESLDRLSRAEPIQAQAQLTAVIMAGITVVTAGDGKVYERERLKAQPMDLIHSLLVMIRANEESETKSRRVRDAIRRQCMNWQAGTFRGFIRYGKRPGWLQVVDGAWQLIPERAEAIRMAVDLFRQGLGAVQIVRRVHAAGLTIGGTDSTSGHLVRLLANPALKGEKHLLLDGTTYVLQGYYPPVLDADDWDALQQLTELRSRRNVKGDIPPVITGFGVAYCAYCGAPLKSQTMASKRRPDGTLADSHRRLQCVSNNSGSPCPVPGSCSAVPVERALMRYCADMVNLRSLYSADRSAVPRSEVAKAQAKLAQLNTQLARLTDALLMSDDAPATFVQRAAELEAERDAVRGQLRAAEASLAQASRAELQGADERWRELIGGVEALDYEARMRARQLVADTFERITVAHHGLPPSAGAQHIDVLLLAKGGSARLIRLDKAGTLLAHDAIS